MNDVVLFFFFSSRRRHTRLQGDWSSDVCSSDLLTGYEMPYATLMYIWENRAPVSTIITNQYTTRVKMIVAESGNDRLGEWREEKGEHFQNNKSALRGGAPPSRFGGTHTPTGTNPEKRDAHHREV